MVQAIIGFLYENFFHIIAAWLVGLFTKKLIDDMGETRAEIIQDAIVTAMYWAEQEYGFATGELKWEKAWRMIRELLDKKGIVMTQKEEEQAKIIMESYVPEINATAYQTVSPEEKKNREIYKRPENIKDMIEYLREKYQKEIEGNENEQN
jgi:hypothetical protein